MKSQADINRKLLCEILNLTEELYGEHLLQKADEWLTLYLGDDQYGFACIRRTKSFWLWWENQWNLRNQEVLDTVVELMYQCGEDIDSLQEYKTDLEKRLLVQELYNTAHSIRNLRLRPNRLVLDETYAVMIGRAIDESIQ